MGRFGVPGCQGGMRLELTRGREQAAMPRKIRTSAKDPARETKREPEMGPGAQSPRGVQPEPQEGQRLMKA